MPYASNRDRAPGPLELTKTPWPLAPLNLSITSGYMRGVFDLVWTRPSDLALNAQFDLMGVNVYRSFDSEFGPYERLTDLPMGSSFWRDQTDNAVEYNEVVTDDHWVLRGVATGEAQGPRYVFHTQKRPLVQSGSQNVLAVTASDVQVYVDGQRATILRIDAPSGEIELDANNYHDVAQQRNTPAVIPVPNSVVTVTYRWNRSFLKTDLGQRVFYRVTTVGVSKDPARANELVETPLEHAPCTSNYETEKLDYMWAQAVRNNAWILTQGGDRVKVFLRKNVGPRCPCFRTRDYKQPLGDCLRCYGTGITGGYEGPYDVILAPDDSERNINHTPDGYTMSHAYETWTGPKPVLAQRDFIVKVNGDRYAIGPVRFPMNRGMVLQQHFTVGRLDEVDIRYRVPMDAMTVSVNRVNVTAPPGNTGALAMTDKDNIPDERELRGRTVTWSNIMY